jgi:hypothetical protein
MLSLQVQTVYQDLLQRFRAAPVSSIEGSILRVEKAGHGYWVARQRIGSKVVEQSIGPDSAETRVRVDVALNEQEVAEAWNRENARLIAMLRSAGCLAPDQVTGKVLSALHRIRFFQSGGILGGTHAFRHYPLELGVDVPSTAYSLTGDVDILAPAHIDLAGKEGSLTARLAKSGLDLRTVFGLAMDDAQKWVIDGAVEPEILAPCAGGARRRIAMQGWGSRCRRCAILNMRSKTRSKQ